MDITVLAKSALMFGFCMVILALNLDDNLVARLGMYGNYAVMLGISAAITLLLLGRNTYVAATVVVLCLLANMPADFSLNFGVDRDVYAGVMMALLMQPFVARLID